MKPTVWSASSRQAKLCTVRTAFRHCKGEWSKSGRLQLNHKKPVPFSRRKSWRCRVSALRDRKCIQDHSHKAQGPDPKHFIFTQRSIHFTNYAAIWEESYLSREHAGNSAPRYKQCRYFSIAEHESLPTRMAAEPRPQHFHYLSKAELKPPPSTALILFFPEQTARKWVPIKLSLLLLCWAGVLNTCRKVITPRVNRMHKWWLPGSNKYHNNYPCLTAWLVYSTLLLPLWNYFYCKSFWGRSLFSVLLHFLTCFYCNTEAKWTTTEEVCEIPEESSLDGHQQSPVLPSGSCI